MKVIVTGATGMVGKGVLLECLDHKDISEVLVITRRSTNEQHPKLKELIHKDFTDFLPVSDRLVGYDACYHCMGVTSAGKSEAEYTKLTYDVSLSLANVLFKNNPEMTFTYVSGAGTDSTEKGRSMWGRVKGKTENDLLKIGFKQAFMFRPGAIIPMKGVQSSTKMYRFFISYFGWITHLMKMLSPNSVTNTTKIGLAMISISQKGYKTQVLNSKDINLASAT